MKKYIVWKEYLSDSNRFADLLNGILFHGENVVKADDIAETGTQTGYAGQTWERQKWNKKICDTVRSVRLRGSCIRIGMELVYSIPLWDLMEGLYGGEQMYQLKKYSRIQRSVSVLLYFERGEWDRPQTLYSPMHLVSVSNLEDTGVFRTDVRQVFDLIWYWEDKTALKKLVMENPYYWEVEADAWEVIVQYANVGNRIKTEEYCREDGKIDTYTAIMELLEDERREGVAEGEERSRKNPIKEVKLQKLEKVMQLIGQERLILWKEFGHEVEK